jgi:beta-barrel assembly-enhancing protease
MTSLSPRLLLAAALASALPTPALHAQAQPSPSVRLPALGESAAEDFSIGTERRLGDQIMAEVRRDPEYLDDPLLLDYLQSVWAPLLAASRARGNIGPDLDAAFAWETFLVRDRSVNAFALPGGFIGVHLGLIAMTGSTDELASVLAHEMSHVTQRHIARSIASSSRQSLVGMAAMVLGILAAGRAGNANATEAVLVGGQAVMAQGQLNFSRDMEREADRIGWGVHQQAGFAASGVVSMFERLDNAYRLSDNSSYPYLRSHPLTVDRIGEARARVEAVAGAPAAQRALLEHTLMQARARVLQEPTVVPLRRAQALETAPFGGVERIAALYASALASLELHEPARAQAALDAAQPLLRMADGEPRALRAFALAQAQTWQAGGQATRALAALDARSGDSASRPVLLARAQAALDASRAVGATAAGVRSSTEALQTWVAEHRADAPAWTLLGQCADLLGLKLRSLRAQAEAQAAIGDMGGAIERLRAAQRQARGTIGGTDFIEASIIDSRLRDLTAQRRAQLAALRGDKRGGERGADRAEPGDEQRTP